MNIFDLMARKKTALPARDEALPGRAAAIPTAETHFVNHRPLKGPYPEGTETAVFGSAVSGARSEPSGKSPGSW